jgi:integrase
MRTELLTPNAKTQEDEERLLDKLAWGREHNDGGKLYLLISAKGAAYWSFRFKLPGDKERKITLGSRAIRTAREARDEAARLRRIVRDGGDPRTARPEGAPGKASPLFEIMARDTMARKTARAAGAKPMHQKSIEKWTLNVETYAKPLHGRQMHTITVDDIIKLLEPIWLTIAPAAGEFRGRLEAIFKQWIAIERGKGVTSHIINPASRDYISCLLPKQPKEGTKRGSHKALPFRLMPAFWAELRKIDTMASKTLQMIILTCVRTNEAQQMKFGQVGPHEECEGVCWTIPDKIMKNGLVATIPLCPTAVALLDEMRALRDRDRPGEELVFPGRDGGEQSENTILQLIQRDMGYSGKIEGKPRATTHGMRTTFRSHGDNKTHHAENTLEFCLHHIEGSDAALAYKKGDQWEKRTAALLDWEAYVTSGVPAAKPKPHLRLVG